MRLWSVHPRYLDTAGLTACWREALLAQKVLTGTTRGYTHHPQLERFLPGSALGATTATIRPDRGRPGPDPDDSPGVGGGQGPGSWPGDRVVAYLHAVADEADARGYRFERSRIAGPRPVVGPIPVTEGQLTYEWALLCAKLAARSPDVLARWAGVVRPDPHPCFVVVPGPVASWERQVPAAGGA